MWELLSLPFVQIALLTSFVLVGIYTYLGFHVVSRGVIFVDLSLAQAAAFGSIVALSLKFEGHSFITAYDDSELTLKGKGKLAYFPIVELAYFTILRTLGAGDQPENQNYPGNTKHISGNGTKEYRMLTPKN